MQNTRMAGGSKRFPKPGGGQKQPKPGGGSSGKRVKGGMPKGKKTVGGK